MMASLINYTSLVLKAWVPQMTSYRFRYFKDKVRCNRRFGYIEPIDQTGLLPHIGGDKRINALPNYTPDDPWKERKALFGQNDYIDILGNEDIHPTRILYNVPSWLRGVKGNEFQILLRKKKMWGRGIFPLARPTKWKHMHIRIQYLYRYLNRKTKTTLQNA